MARVDAGPKGAVAQFHNDHFANPEGLVQLMQGSRGLIKLQSDHKLVFKGNWDLPEHRLKGVRGFMAELADVAAASQQAAS